MGYGFIVGSGGWIFLIPCMIFAMWAQGRVKSNYGKYLRVANRRGITGHEAARRILDANGLYDVKIHQSRGTLSDHYDPRNRSVNLSADVYGRSSVASLAIAAHEVGHAIQHAKAYGPLKFRSALFPLASFGTKYVWFLVIAGVFFNITGLIDLGIIFFMFSFLFQVVTLPVEFDASKRAILQLDGMALLDENEVTGAKKVLNAAAMTYVAAAATSLAQLMRLLLIRGSRD